MRKVFAVIIAVMAVMIVGGIWFWFFSNKKPSQNNFQSQNNSSVPAHIGQIFYDLPEVYASGSNGFSIRYPVGYSVDESYRYQEFGPGLDIGGVKFVIPATMATGVNLSNFDTGVSVEEILNTQECSANLFVDQANPAVSIIDRGVSYSVAEMSGAGAGNFYEEKVWVILGINPCIAVRYFIHSTNIGNYTPGTIKEFDKQALIDQFDEIRRSLIINQ